MHHDSLHDALSLTDVALIDRGQLVDSGRWQGVSTGGKPDLMTREILDVSWTTPMWPPHLDRMRRNYVLDYWREQVKPNLPWADDHFAERVSRVPSNPGEQYKNWPWWHGQEATTGVLHNEFKFTHTYQERFWPKYPNNRKQRASQMMGIRYEYGDLDDVVNLLLREPYTRQAYLPIFFPEDTGAVHGGRIPCTLGYYFLLRDDKLHLWYTIRSCDAVRHFRDDVYLALRLALWVLEELRQRGRPEFWDRVTLGTFSFKAFSFHVHMGDYHLLRRELFGTD